jgi:hypothetical protein
MQLAVVFALKVLVCNLKLSNMATFLTVRQQTSRRERRRETIWMRDARRALHLCRSQGATSLLEALMDAATAAAAGWATRATWVDELLQVGLAAACNPHIARCAGSCRLLALYLASLTCRVARYGWYRRAGAGGAR